MENKIQTIAVIGGSGFLGNYLIPLLSKDHQVLNLDLVENSSLDCKTIICDVRDKKNLKENLTGVDLVILLAAKHLDNVRPIDLYYSTNVDGMQNVLECIQELKIKKLVFTSSVAVYGFNQKGADESALVEPYNDYGISKLKAERKIEEFQKDYSNFECDIIRPTVIFGTGNRGNVYTLFNMVSKGWFFNVGSGQNFKSLCYVENMAAFIVHLIQNPSTQKRIFNYADYPNINLNETVDLIAKILKLQVKKVNLNYYLAYLTGAGLDFLSFFTKSKYKLSRIRVQKYCANSMYLADKAFETFTPPFKLEEALEKTLNQEFK